MNHVLSAAGLTLAGLALACSTPGSAFVPCGAGGSCPPLPLDAGERDAANDAPEAEDCPGAGLGFTMSNIAPCDIPKPPPNSEIEIEEGELWNLDTDEGTLELADGSRSLPLSFGLVRQVAGPDILVLSVKSLVIKGAVRALGSRPLALVSFSNVEITGNGRLFATEVSGLGRGAGAGLSAFCDATDGTGADGTSQMGAAGPAGRGGGGGGFAAAGGSGGPVEPGLAPTRAGRASGSADLVPLRGGCDGGLGGGGGGRGGGGGGAVVIAAGTEIQLSAGDSSTAAVIAFGFGGRGAAAAGGGGGGGGSGGAILFEAPLIEIAGSVTANGGGGGEGSRDGAGDQGKNGVSGALRSASEPSPGGSGGNGGDGGDGAVALVDPTDGAPGIAGATNAGAGGGGGSPGRIRFNADVVEILPGAVISPAPSICPLGWRGASCTAAPQEPPATDP